MEFVPTNFPLFEGRSDFDYFGRLIPAKKVGGDLIDIFLLNDKQLFLSISDTLGKGIPASIYAARTKFFIRNIANPVTRLGEIMESLNDSLCLESTSDMFATVFMGKLDLDTGKLIYCNSGHPQPLILRNNNREEVLIQSHGIPVGLKLNLKFAESSTILAPGESLIIYTDGVTEQCDEKGEYFATERLIGIVSQFRDLSAQDIVNKTLDVLKRFRGITEVHDDIALAALKFFGK